MTDRLRPDERSRLMAKIRSGNTRPEIAVRRIVHQMGYRFRLHRKDLPGRPDIVLPRLEKVILVHGCFWHGHDCAHGRREPKTNVGYWRAKIERNRDRDVRTAEKLEAAGWSVLTIWECDLKDEAGLHRRLEVFLDVDRARCRTLIPVGIS